MQHAVVLALVLSLAFGTGIYFYATAEDRSLMPVDFLEHVSQTGFSFASDGICRCSGAGCSACSSSPTPCSSYSQALTASSSASLVPNAAAARPPPPHSTILVTIALNSTSDANWHSQQMASSVQRQLQKLTKCIGSISQIDVESQHIHMADAGAPIHRNGSDAPYILVSELWRFAQQSSWSLNGGISDGHMFHVVVFSAADNLKGLHIRSSARHSDLLPYFAFPGWGVVIIVDSTLSTSESLSFATAAAAAALRRELGFSSAPSPPNLTSCILSTPELAVALPAAATSRWCDAAADLSAFALEVASMASLTGTSKLSASFEAAVKMLDQAAALLPADMEAASVLTRDAMIMTRAVQRDCRVLLSLYVPNDHLFALYAPYFGPTLLPALLLIFKHIKSTRAAKLLKQKTQ